MRIMVAWFLRYRLYRGGKATTILKNEFIESYTAMQLWQHRYLSLYYIVQSILVFVFVGVPSKCCKRNFLHESSQPIRAQ